MSTHIKNIIKGFFTTVAILGADISNSINDSVIQHDINSRSSYVHQHVPFDSSVRAIAKLKPNNIKEIRASGIAGISKEEIRKILKNHDNNWGVQITKLNSALDLMLPLATLIANDIQNDDINELSNLASNMEILHQALFNLTKIVKIKDTFQIMNQIGLMIEKISIFLYQINLAKIAQTRNEIGYTFDSEINYSEKEIQTILFGN